MLYGTEPGETAVLKMDLVAEQPMKARTGPLKRWSDLKARQPTIFFPVGNMKYCKSGLQEEKITWLKLLIFSSSDTKAKRAPTGQVVAALFEINKPCIRRTSTQNCISTYTNTRTFAFPEYSACYYTSIYGFSAYFLLISNYTFSSWGPRASQHTLH